MKQSTHFWQRFSVVVLITLTGSFAFAYDSSPIVGKTYCERAEKPFCYSFTNKNYITTWETQSPPFLAMFKFQENKFPKRNSILVGFAGHFKQMFTVNRKATKIKDTDGVSYYIKSN